MGKRIIDQKPIKSAVFFIKLVKYGIEAENKTFPAKPDDVRWEDIFLLAKRHSLTPVVYQYVKKVKNEIGGELFSKWERDISFCILIDMEQQYAWDEIKSCFSQKEVPLLPMKGFLLKNLYLETYMRMMGDLDILYRADCKEMINEGLKELGYSYAHSESTVDSFFRPTNTNIEAHYSLVPEHSPFFEYYSGIWQKAIPTETPYIFALSKEDEYIFLLIHAYKHFYGNGTGVRTIADLYLFNKKYGDVLDRSYINRELEKAEDIAKKSNKSRHSLKEFEIKIRKIISQWFESEDVIIDDTGLGIVTGGVYGSIRDSWKNTANKMGRFKYILYRLFPPYSQMKSRYNALKKVPVLLPLFWIWRIITGVFKRRKMIVKEFKTVTKEK